MKKIDVSQAHLDFIPKIYDTMINPDNWTSVLDEFAFHCGAKASSLMVGDYVYPELLNRPTSSLLSDLDLAYYDKTFGADELAAVKVVCEHPVQNWISDVVAFGKAADKIPCTLYQREHCSIDRRSAICLNDTPIWIDVMSLNYELGRDNITDEEISISQIFIPHFAKVVELNRPLALLKNRFNAVLSVLDFLKIGIVITNRTGEVLIFNQEADATFDADDGMSLSRHKKMTMRSPELQNSLNRAIAAAADSHDPSTFEATMIAPKRSRGSAWLLDIFPLNDLQGQIDGVFQGAAIFIIDPDRKDVISTHGMEALYGLTPAEGQVSALLAEGMRSEEIADTRNTSPETVRSQIKSLFTKTDSNSQADLVRLALKVNLPVK